VLAFGLGGLGCRGIYYQTQALYPADPSARLQLRIEEAQQAEKEADQAAARLVDRYARGIVGQSLDPDIDRLEMAALEFNRRTATARDAAAKGDGQSRFSGESGRLTARSAQMLETIRLIRSDGISCALPQLNNLLATPVRP
jgi:hypothetical protein